MFSAPVPFKFFPGLYYSLQDERASWSGTVSRLKEAESAAQRMHEEREALEIDVQILRQKLAALECSGNAVATTSSVFQQVCASQAGSKHSARYIQQRKKWYESIDGCSRHRKSCYALI